MEELESGNDTEGRAMGPPQGSPPEVLRVLDGFWQSDPFGLRKKQRHSPGNQAKRRFQGDRFT